jgi:hypothetical protein
MAGGCPPVVAGPGVGCCHPFAAVSSGMMGFAVCWSDGINQEDDRATGWWGS